MTHNIVLLDKEDSQDYKYTIHFERILTMIDASL